MPMGGAAADGDFSPGTVEIPNELVFDPTELPAQSGQAVISEPVGSVEHTVTVKRIEPPKLPRISRPVDPSPSRPPGTPS